MMSNDWRSLRRNRWTTIGLVVVAAVVLLFFRFGHGQTLDRAWSLYSPGYVLKATKTADQELQNAAMFVRMPGSLADLPYAGAVVHPEGLRGVAFVELLYGRMGGSYLDVSESQTPLALGVSGHKERLGAVQANVGRIKLRGRSRSFALFRHAGLYYLVVAPPDGQVLRAGVEAIAPSAQ